MTYQFVDDFPIPYLFRLLIFQCGTDSPRTWGWGWQQNPHVPVKWNHWHHSSSFLYSLWEMPRRPNKSSTSLAGLAYVRCPTSWTPIFDVAQIMSQPGLIFAWTSAENDWIDAFLHQWKVHPAASSFDRWRSGWFLRQLGADRRTLWKFLSFKVHIWMRYIQKSIGNIKISINW